MADPRTIQRYPRGLLQLLGIRASETVGGLNREVSGVIDLIQMLTIDNEERQTATNAALASGGNLAVTVPDGETWALNRCQFFFVQPAGPLTTLTAIFNYGVQTIGWASYEPRTFIAGSINGAAFMPSYPVILPSGSEISVGVTFAGAAAINATMRAGITRLG